MEVRNLTFSYEKKGKIILDDVSLKISQGKITTIIGANGCGKSTLFNLMTKNLVVTKGKIYLDGKSIKNMKQKSFAKKVAIVHQNNHASEDITVENLVMFGRTPHQKGFATKTAEDEEIVDWALKVTNLIQYREREVRSLSGGQRQRVWIAMALAQKTKILFLDEPTTYLDIRYQIEILEMVQRLNKEYKITVIMVLHDMNHAAYYSDEIIGLCKGKVLIQGAPADVITPDNIEKIYGIRLDVGEYEGRVYVSSVRKIEEFKELHKEDIEKCS